MKRLIPLSLLTVASTSTLAGDAVSTVPEPSTWLLFGAAAIAVLALKKFKK